MCYLMKLQKVLFVFTMTLMISSIQQVVHAGGAGKGVDLLVNESGLLELLSNKGIRGLSANRLKNSGLNSIKNLNASGSLPSAYQLQSILRNLNVTSDSIDAVKKVKIRRLLNKSHKDITKDEITDLFNDLIYLSHRYGYSKTTALACSQCVSDALYSRGFKYTLEVLENKNSAAVMKNHIPKTPSKLRRFIAKEMTNSQMGDFSRATTKQVGKEEEKALGLFLGLSKYGSAKQKAFTKAVKEVSKMPSGNVSLVDSQNSHKLWKIISSNLTDQQLDGWTDILNKTATKAKGQRSKKEAFFSVLEAKAGNHPGMKERLKILKRKNCFFQ